MGTLRAVQTKEMKEMSELVIDKNIPIPQPKIGRPQVLVFHDLEVGDSVFFEGLTATKVYAQFARLKPKKFCTRKVEGGVRVWRVV